MPPTRWGSRFLLKVQLLTQPLLIVANHYFTVNVNYRHYPFAGPLNHLLTGGLIAGNVQVLKGNIVIAKKLLNFMAPGSGCGGINFN